MGVQQGEGLLWQQQRLSCVVAFMAEASLPAVGPCNWGFGRPRRGLQCGRAAGLVGPAHRYLLMR